MNKYKCVESDLRKYKGKKAFILNAEKQIELLKEEPAGIKPIIYSDMPSSYGQFNSCIEDEIIDREINIEERIPELEKKIMWAKELVERVDRSLEVLNETERDVIEIFYIEGLPWFKVTEKVNISQSGCKKIRTKAIKRLILPMYGEKEEVSV